MSNPNLPIHWIIIVLLSFPACKNDPNLPTSDPDSAQNLPPIPSKPTLPFHVDGSNILKNSVPVSLNGVNALQTFGLVDPNLMNEWKIQIVREFVGNLREQPIDANAIQASDGKWYHPLQKIVNQNRANNKITIICPFGWVDQNGKQTLFTGLNPSSQDFFPAYLSKMQNIANHFKNQPDVWIEVWNEPYHWDNQANYSHDLWLKDMKEMIDNLRKVGGFESIILVPGNEQGQSESAIIAKGKELMKGRYNLVFDLHAYEKWLKNSTETQIINRIQSLQKLNFAFVIGEIGVSNAGHELNPNEFLKAAKKTNLSVLAWLWNQNTSYKNALLTDDGLPNATQDNNYWGNSFREFLK
jgi:mannan endo-1,4-beta-mannosidase